MQLATVFGACVGLAACSSSPPAGLLTQSDIPSYLGVKADRSSSAGKPPSAIAAPSCKTANIVVFDTSWKHQNNQRTSSVATIANTSWSCASASQAQRYFNSIKTGAKGYPLPGIVGHSVPGVGDEAWLVDGDHEADIRIYSIA